MVSENRVASRPGLNGRGVALAVRPTRATSEEGTTGKGAISLSDGWALTTSVGIGLPPLVTAILDSESLTRGNTRHWKLSGRSLELPSDIYT